MVRPAPVWFKEPLILMELAHFDLIKSEVYLLPASIKFQSIMNKAVQQTLRLLQLNLFETRDLMALLRETDRNLASDIRMHLL